MDIPVTIINRQGVAQESAPGLTSVKIWMGVVAVGLILSGLTCYWLPAELALVVKFFEVLSLDQLPLLDEMYAFVVHTKAGVDLVAREYPQLFLGTDYLGFAHVLLGILFIGAVRDPVKNIWIIEFGLIACVLVIPAAFLFGYLRGAPLMHYLVDSSFGVVAIFFLIKAYQRVREVERNEMGGSERSHAK